MKATETLHNRGQSLWLDNITRNLLDRGTLLRYVTDFAGLTSNSTIFDHAIKNSEAYDAAIRKRVREGIRRARQVNRPGAGHRLGRP